MRRLTTVVVAIAALAIPSSALANAAPANQTPGVPGFVSGWVGSSQANTNITVTQYRASYDQFGGVVCSGVHQVGKNMPPPGQDSFTCTSSTGLPLQGVSPGETFYLGSGGWYSDYYQLLNGSVVLSVGGSATVSADGLSFTAVVTYF